MTIGEWINLKISSLFNKKLPEAEQAQKEIDKVLNDEGTSAQNSAFAETLKDDNLVYSTDKSFTQKLNDLVVMYQKIESGLDSRTGHREFSDEDIMKIVLGSKLEKLGISGVQALDWIKGIGKIAEEPPFSWPVHYLRDGKTASDTLVLIPATREADIIGLQNSEGVLELREALRNSVSLVDGDRGFEITAKSLEKYHGEDCTVDYSCLYTTEGDTTVYGVRKTFDPETTSENGIHQSLTVTKIKGQVVSLEEIREGYLEDKDNYYFKSYKTPEGEGVHVICGKVKSPAGEYDISYEDKNLGVHSYDYSIAKQLYEKGLSSTCKAGKKIITDLSNQMKKALSYAKEI